MSFSGRFAESLLLQDTDPKAAQALIRNIMQSRLGPEEQSLQQTLTRFLKKQVGHQGTSRRPRPR